jgi:hypothetical protein
MTVTPNDSHCVVALSHHVGRVNVLRDLIYLEDLPSIELIYTAGALAGKPQIVGRYLFSNLVSLHYMYQAILRLILYFRLGGGFFQVSKLPNHILSDGVISLYQLGVLG